MSGQDKNKTGDYLLKSGLINEQQLEQAYREQKQTGEHLGKILVGMGAVTEDALVSFLAQQMSIPKIDLGEYLISPDIINLVPENIAKRYKLIPVFKIGNSLTVAMADPMNIFAIDEVSLKTGCTVETALATESEIQKAIDQYYGVTGTMEEVVKSIGEDKLDIGEGENIELKKLQDLVEEAPVIKLVNLLMLDAIKNGASDIHIEPEEQIMRIRYRVDGVLQEVNAPPKHLQPAIISRIKIMADLDIAERRLPQDGKFQIKMENRQVDIRVSTFPTIYGENVVMRILDAGSILLGLDKLGFSPQNLKIFGELINRPHGVFLVTGPTGSGKTTTLYSGLNQINTIEKNIITVEDPVEYRLKLIRQSQVNPKIGLTFAVGLRSILRQDPDVIMVGEIRDMETAEIAVHSALTGHLVLSTLHTNDAPGALTRLIDMGIEPFLVASSVIAVLAQRLVRTICTNCKEQYTPAPEIIRRIGLPAEKSIILYRGKGCNKCMKTGYKGRLAIFELMAVDEKVKELTITKASSDDIKKAARQAGMKTLREDGLDKVIAGKTTVEELFRLTQD